MIGSVPRTQITTAAPCLTSRRAPARGLRPRADARRVLHLGTAVIPANLASSANPPGGCVVTALQSSTPNAALSSGGSERRRRE